MRTNFPYHRPHSLTHFASVRMLASPLRKCAVTGRYMPSDFLIRLLPMKLPASRASRIRAIIVPDGLQHPRFESKRRGKAGYITCWAEVLAQAPQRGTWLNPRNWSKGMSD